MLYLYLAAAVEAVSAVLIRVERTQVLVYYASRALRGTKVRYTRVEKLVLGLVHTVRRLKPYFLTHPISVGTDQPIRQILVQLEASGGLTKWAVELGEYDLSYESRTAIKAQALADFLAELTGAGLLLEDPHGEVYSYAIRFDFSATNNEAEYKVLITGFRLARKFGARRIQVPSDSQLVACQVLDEYEAKEEAIQRYLSKVHQLTAHFKSFEIQRILRSQNRRADVLSRLASTSFSTLSKTVLIEVLAEPEYLEETIYPVHAGDTWMSSLISFLGQEIFPEDRVEAEKNPTQNCSVRTSEW
ncbi:uncharacterized protein [Coffea arabica]|uniref:Reverse transcriptase RNase H-like domain-containing protein n=1 Tax=Coffea arabica TaxID=13443 RepID=A0ABM4WNB4_COFAR